MNESETRAEYIDPKLKARGWGEVKDQKSCVNFVLPTEKSKQAEREVNRKLLTMF